MYKKHFREKISTTIDFNRIRNEFLQFVVSDSTLAHAILSSTRECNVQLNCKQLNTYLENEDLNAPLQPRKM